MATYKTLNEQISDIMTAKTSRTTKRYKLAGLNLSNAEINMLFAVATENGTMGINEPRPRVSRNNTLANLIKSMTFGVEIECVNAPRNTILDIARANGIACTYEGYSHVNSNSHYKLVTDGSLHGENPIECVTPILKGSNDGFNSLKGMCDVLAQVGAGVNKSCGLHVHVAYPNMTDEHYVNVFKNYQKLEGIIDTFMAESRRNGQWCATIRTKNYSTCLNPTDVYYANGGRNSRPGRDSSRYVKVNACSWFQHHTIEFRQHQGTTNYGKIEMWVRFVLKLVAWSKDNVLTENVTSINDIKFLTDTEKQYFAGCAEQLNGSNAEVA